jgi:dolichol-phosphate mannosyltransferase
MANIPENYEILIVKGDRETKNYPYDTLPHQREIKTFGDSLERSILNGFSQADGGKVVVMDADGSHLPEAIPKFVRALDSVEMVVGTRFIEGSHFKASISRRIVTWGCAWLAHLARSRLTDPMSGFFGVRKEVMDRIKFKPFPWKTALEIELRARPSLKEVPIHFEERTLGKSKTSIKIGLKIIWSLCAEICRKVI